MIAQDYLAQLAESGIQPEDNLQVAKRIPPVNTTPMHPKEFFEVWEQGGLFAEFAKQMPKPPELALHFKSSVDTQNSLSSVLSYNPRANT